MTPNTMEYALVTIQYFLSASVNRELQPYEILCYQQVCRTTQTWMKMINDDLESNDSENNDQPE